MKFNVFRSFFPLLHQAIRSLLFRCLTGYISMPQPIFLLYFTYVLLYSYSPHIVIGNTRILKYVEPCKAVQTLCQCYRTVEKTLQYCSMIRPRPTTHLCNSLHCLQLNHILNSFPILILTSSLSKWPICQYIRNCYDKRRSSVQSVKSVQEKSAKTNQ